MKDGYIRRTICLPVKVDEWLERKAKEDKRPSVTQYISVTLEKMMEAEISRKN